MALNKRGIDVSAIKRDQAAIDKLPNKGRASVDHSKSSALAKRTHKGPVRKLAVHDQTRSEGMDIRKYGDYVKHLDKKQQANDRETGFKSKRGSSR